MRLILVRHAEASYDAPSDFERHLTDKGIKQSKKVARFLAGLSLKPERIVTSPVVRAKETADYLAKRLPSAAGLIEDERLSCGMMPEDGCAVLQECQPGELVIFVGHEPDFSRLVAFLIGLGSTENIDFKKAAAVVIDIERPTKGDGVLRAFVPVKYL